jgi:hypothetical protein
MKPQTTKKILTWSSIAILLGVGGYFAYTKLLKPYLERKKTPNQSGEQQQPIDTTTPPSGGQLPKTFLQARKEASDSGKFAFQFTEDNGNKAFYSTKTGFKVQTPIAMPPLTQKASIKKVQEAVNSLGGNLVTDGIFGINTANGIAKYWDRLKWNPPSFGIYNHPFFSTNPFSPTQKNL